VGGRPIKIRKYAIIARVSFSNAVAYRSSVVARFVFYALFIYTFARLWGVIYGAADAQGTAAGVGAAGVPGLSFAQIVWYLIFAELMTFTCGTGVYHSLNGEVKSGAVAYMLGRPTHFVAFQLANELGRMLMDLICFGALAAALGFAFAGPLPGFSPSSLPPIAASFAMGILLNYFSMMLIALSAFALEDNLALFLIYQKATFMLGMLLPVDILPSWLQSAARALPFSYVYWAPSRLFVGYSPQLFFELAPPQALWCAATAALCMLAYRGGARKLQINGG
jgi:ABC-2 type transport system permease protein